MLGLLLSGYFWIAHQGMSSVVRDGPLLGEIISSIVGGVSDDHCVNRIRHSRLGSGRVGDEMVLRLNDQKQLSLSGGIVPAMGCGDHSAQSKQVPVCRKALSISGKQIAGVIVLPSLSPRAARESLCGIIPYRQLSVDAHICCYALPSVGGPRQRRGAERFSGALNELGSFHLNLNPRAIVGLVGGAGERISLARQIESPEDQEGAAKREGGVRPARPPLRFGSGGGPILGIQILGIMCVGFGFAVLSVKGLSGIFDDPDRDWLRRVRYWAYLAVGALGGLTFYGWAWLGHPLAIWGLA